MIFKTKDTHGTTELAKSPETGISEPDTPMTGESDKQPTSAEEHRDPQQDKPAADHDDRAKEELPQSAGSVASSADLVSWNQQDGVFTLRIGNMTDKTLVVNELARRAATAANPDERKAATQILTAYLHQSSEVIKSAADSGKLENREAAAATSPGDTVFAAQTGTKAIQKVTNERDTLKGSLLQRSVIHAEPAESGGLRDMLQQKKPDETIGNGAGTSGSDIVVPAVDEEEG